MNNSTLHNATSGTVFTPSTYNTNWESYTASWKYMEAPIIRKAIIDNEKRAIKWDRRFAYIYIIIGTIFYGGMVGCWYINPNECSGYQLAPVLIHAWLISFGVIIYRRAKSRMRKLFVESL